ncbi:MAG: sulfatase-like hydrolase/transferase [Mariniblastus sp.]
MNSPEIRNAVVLVVDRLGANMLSVYGNTMFETENFNRLAARSIVFDQAITPSTKIEDAYQSLWSGVLPAGDPQAAGSAKNPPNQNSPTDGSPPLDFKNTLMEKLGTLGISSALLTDAPQIENLEASSDFDRVIPIRTTPSEKLADAPEQTELASFFAQATQWLTDLEPRSLTWLHARGLSGAWDAPYELRCRFADSEDPDPPTFHQPPARLFDAASDDPDELLGYQQACAAQVMMLDDFLGVILDLMDSPEWSSTLFVVMSTRGYPMGEHQIVGDLADANLPDSCDATDSQAPTNLSAAPGIHSESVHVPLIVCLPNHESFADARAVRNGSLVQTEWVHALLSDWFTSPSESNFDRIWKSAALSLPNKRHEAACVHNGDFRAIQTHAWKLITNGQHTELFAKPDDRWEVNDVSRRCSGVIEELSDILQRWTADRGLGGLELPEHLSVRSE